MLKTAPHFPKVMPMRPAQIPPQRLRPGTVVTVQMKGLFKLAHHFALVTDKRGADGLPIVVANSGETRGPGEQSWRGFVKGREYRAFYPSTLPSRDGSRQRLCHVRHAL